MKLLNALYISGYRGFKNEQTLLLSNDYSITFLLGPNNSGKSLITRLLSMICSISISQEIDFKLKYEITDKDFYYLDTEKPINIKIDFAIEAFQNTGDPNFERISSFSNVKLCYDIYKRGDEYRCFTYLIVNDFASHSLRADHCEFNSYFSMLSKSDTEKTCIALHELVKKSILVFDPIRSFDRSSKLYFGVSGNELVEWMNQKKDTNELRKAKQYVRQCLTSLNLDGPDHVFLEGKDTLVFAFEDGLHLNPHEVGTGYAMLYILLMEIYKNQKKVIIIDEIESHLQPGLSRKLIEIIRSHDIQFVIATHSPAIMETAKESDYLYRFKKMGKSCYCEGFFRNRREHFTNDAIILREVCNELGVIPADALLSNCVIWVEGPSELFWIRVWLKHFIPEYLNKEKIHSSLIEGLHYSILMSGGGLISNLAFVEEELFPDAIEEDDKLCVLRVNPNPFVIIDSDNTKPTSEKFKRCLRIANELNQQNKIHPYFSGSTVETITCRNEIDNVCNLWLLKGKELENYAHPQLLKEFYTDLSNKKNSKVVVPSGMYDWNVYSETKGAGYILEQRSLQGVAESQAIKHKIPLARFVFNNFANVHLQEDPVGIEKPSVEMLADLKSNLTKLLDYIITVNDLRS